MGSMPEIQKVIRQKRKVSTDDHNEEPAPERPQSRPRAFVTDVCNCVRHVSDATSRKSDRQILPECVNAMVHSSTRVAFIYECSSSHPPDFLHLLWTKKPGCVPRHSYSTSVLKFSNKERPGFIAKPGRQRMAASDDQGTVVSGNMFDGITLNSGAPLLNKSSNVGKAPVEKVF